MIDFDRLLSQLEEPYLVCNALTQLRKLIRGSPVSAPSQLHTLFLRLQQMVEGGDEQSCLQALGFLVEEVSSQYREQAKVLKMGPLMRLLASSRGQIRKSCHSLAIKLMKVLGESDSVVQAYSQFIQSSQEPKPLQKSVQSLQGIFINYEKSLAQLGDSSILQGLVSTLAEHARAKSTPLSRSCQQTLTSIINNKFFTKHVPSFSSAARHQLNKFCAKLGIQFQCQESQQQAAQSQSQPKEDALQLVLQSLNPDKPWYVKSEKIQELQAMMLSPLPVNAALAIPVVAILVSDANFKVSLVALNILDSVMADLRERLQEETVGLVAGTVCERLGDSKLALRQVSAKLVRANLQSKTWAVCLVQSVRKGNPQIKDQFIQICEDSLPPQHESQLLGLLCKLVEEQKTKTKIRCINLLVRLAQSRSSARQLIQVNLIPVYLDMFQDRLHGASPPLELAKPESLERPTVQSHFERRHQNIFRHGMLSKHNYQTLNSVNTANTSQINQQGLSAYSAFPVTQPFLGTNYSKDSRVETQSKTVQGLRKCDKDRDSTPSSLARADKPSLKQRVRVGNKKTARKEEQKQEYPMKPQLVRIAKLQKLEDQNGRLIVQSKQFSVNRPEKQIENLCKPKMMYRSEQLEEREEKRNSFRRKEKAIPEYKTACYLDFQQLEALERPQHAFKMALADIRREEDWERQFEAINTVRCLAAHHSPTLLGNLPAFAGLVADLVKLIDSLRSSLAKNSMICVGELSVSFRRVIEGAAQSIFVRLFRKAQDANSFITAEVRKCFGALSENLPPSRLVPILSQHFQHKANVTKTYIAFCIEKMAEKSFEKLSQCKEYGRVLEILGQLAGEASAEVRSGAKRAFLEVAGRSGPRDELMQFLKRSVREPGYSKLKAIAEKQQQEGLVVLCKGNFA